MTTHSYASEHKDVAHAFEHKGLTHVEAHSKAHLKNTIIISQPDLKYSVFEHMSRRILKKAYSIMGKDIVFEAFPVERSIAVANAGITDGELARITGLQSSYLDLIEVPIPIAFDKVYAYSKEHDFTVDGWQSLKPYKVDHILGFKLAEQKSKGLNATKVKTIEQGLNRLRAGRSDVFIGISGVDCLIRKNSYTDVKALMPHLDELIMYHYLHKRHKDLAEELGKVLLQMQQNGEIGLIQKQVKQEFISECES